MTRGIAFGLWLLAIGLAMAAVAATPMSMEDLYGNMDREALEAEIALGAGGAERLKRVGIAWHNLAVLKVDDASERADEMLARARKALPKDPEVLAYLGSAGTMVARDSWNVVTKVSRVNKGVNLIDKAVRMDPENVAVRMVRANNSLALPEFFKRRGKALEDLRYLHSRVDSIPLRAETAAEVALKLGELETEMGDVERARELFEEARRRAPGSTWSLQAAERFAP